MRRAVTPIIALDVGSAGEALSLAQSLREHCGFFKVGLELFTAAGPDVVRRLRDEVGAEVFLDLKLHDIPNTVAGAVRSASQLGVRLLTIHGSGGHDLLRAARDAAAEQVGLLAVTVLTSMDEASLGQAWGRQAVDVSAEVLRLADAAARAQLHGVVCSGREARGIKAVHGDALALLVPGIRLAGGAVQDQRRTVTPAEAALAGASYVVIGRAVTAAADPLLALADILTELNAAVQGSDPERSE